jgi:aminoglycoside phosphotransferase (APT) family kinase protein
VPPPDPHWFGGRDELRPGELIGHGDAAPYNAVWTGTELVVIDWDLAHPMPPLEDLAFMALMWVPLTARDVAAADGFAPDVDRPRRLRLLLDAYGWTGTEAAVLAAVRARARAHADGLRAAAAAGYPPAVELVAEGVADAFDRAVAELDAGPGHRDP